MNCIVCSKELVSRRKDARFCSAKCRKTASRVTDNPEKTVTDKIVTDKVTLKDRWLCSVEGCFLRCPPGHKGFCIYHWRKSEDMSTITEEDYNKLNEWQKTIEETLNKIDVNETLKENAS